MGKLTVHVLDISRGTPASGMRIELHDLSRLGALALASRVTDIDGRCRESLLENERLTRGRYCLTFHVGDYFRARGIALPDPAFLDDIAVQFGIAEPDQHYHIPLLVSPWSYSVYRGG